MDRYRTAAFSVVLGLALIGGTASAYARSNESGGEEIGRIRYINRTQNLVQLTNGDEFRTSDARMLAPLHEGDLVKVDFSFNGDHAILNSIEPASPDDTPGASIGTEGGVQQH